MILYRGKARGLKGWISAWKRPKQIKMVNLIYLNKQIQEVINK